MSLARAEDNAIREIAPCGQPEAAVVTGRVILIAESHGRAVRKAAVPQHLPRHPLRLRHESLGSGARLLKVGACLHLVTEQLEHRVPHLELDCLIGVRVRVGYNVQAQNAVVQLGIDPERAYSGTSGEQQHECADAADDPRGDGRPARAAILSAA